MNRFSSPAVRGRIPIFVISLIVLIGFLFAAASPGMAQEPVLPDAPPDGYAGLELYAARCANCHGPLGQGDGSLILEMGGQPPKAFDQAYGRTAQPAAMFAQITNGNLEVGMPPFGPASSNPIAEAGRWDLVAAVYSLATPPEAVAAGQAVYAAQCAACHGDGGRGDGPDAPADPAPADLTSLDYWYNRSNQTVFTALAPGTVASHTYELSDDDRWRVVDYARTFTYEFADPVELTRPIPAGTIAGVLVNGTTGERLPGAEMTLRAFTPDFTQTLTLTATTDANGNYRFDLTDVPPDWVFLVNTAYNGLNFSSGADQLSRRSTALDLPVTVYEQTTDPAAPGIGQLHMVIEFIEDRLQVSELYIFNNNRNAVFIGESGDPAQGTVEIALPAGAENLSFQRSFGSLSNFLPADDFIQTERGWADTMPLRAGPGALSLLVRYTLPFSSGMTLAHPLYYDTTTSTLILPDNGVSVSNEPWTRQPSQQFGQNETFLNYSRAGLTAGEAIAVQLQGRPRVVAGTDGTSSLNRNRTAEMLIGGAVALLAAGAGVVIWRSWQGRQGSPAALSGTAAAPPATRDELLRAIADLDDAREAGQIDEAVYQARRAALKEQLAAVWQQ